MRKTSAYTTMQLIADILSFNTNREALSEQFIHEPTDWDAVVIVASQHLMLPALYCQLKTKDLLHLIPEDLQLYLEEIAAINRGRNEVLLKEVHEISEILEKEQIDHVFIKGTALLASDVFEDPAERMIGDIDILVAQNQIHQAFDLLTKYGYTESLEREYESDTGRHLQRQVSPGKFGAIELHNEILLHTHQQLIDKEQVLKNKKSINDIAVPSTEDSIRISVLALQINDRAHILGYLHFKTIYDCLALNLISNQSLFKELSTNRHSQSFLHISSIFFKELSAFKVSKYSKFIRRYFTFRLRYPKWGRLMYSSVNASLVTRRRLKVFVNNKSYRRHILKNRILPKLQKSNQKT